MKNSKKQTKKWTRKTKDKRNKKTQKKKKNKTKEKRERESEKKSYSCNPPHFFEWFFFTCGLPVSSSMSPEHNPFTLLNSCYLFDAIFL